MDMRGVRKDRVGFMERVPWKHTLPYVKETANRNCRMTQGTQTGAL